MASTISPRSSPARRARPATPEHGKKAVARAAGAKVPKGAAKAAAKKAVARSDNGVHPARGLAKVAAKKVLQRALRKTVQSGTGRLRTAADRAAVAGRSAIASGVNHRFLPVQLSIDVAVPVDVAWKEWVDSGSLPEGIHRIKDIERDGDMLVGRTAGPRSTAWEAEIKDDREGESFAWHSIAGSDCAGLVTFHSLGERLTRIELDLDVLPTNPSEAMVLASRLAHRRAEADLRRFKARVEFINPDVYESNRNRNGNGRAGRNPEKKKAARGS